MRPHGGVCKPLPYQQSSISPLCMNRGHHQFGDAAGLKTASSVATLPSQHFSRHEVDCTEDRYCRVQRICAAARITQHHPQRLLPHDKAVAVTRLDGQLVQGPRVASRWGGGVMCVIADLG